MADTYGSPLLKINNHPKRMDTDESGRAGQRPNKPLMSPLPIQPERTKRKAGQIRRMDTADRSCALLILRLAGDVDPQTTKNILVYRGEDHRGMYLAAPQLPELLHGDLGSRIGSRTDR